MYGIDASWPGGSRLKQHARCPGLAQAVLGQQGGCLRADEYLAGVGLVLHRDRTGPCGAGGQHLEVRRAHREEMEESRVHALRHLQRDFGARQLDPSDLVEFAAHPHRGRAGTRRVVIALEPQQLRVAAELEQAGALLVGDLQDRRETAADRVGDLFRAFAAASPCQLFGELREAGNVGEHGGTLRSPVATLGVVDQMLLENAGQIRNRAFGVGFRHGQLLFVFRVRRVRTCYIVRPDVRSWRGQQ